METETYASLLSSIAQILTRFNGVGIAANQLGINDRFFVALIPGVGPKMFIDPRIVVQGKEIESEEGCLSIPGYYDTIIRYEEVHINYLDMDGDQFEETYTGHEAVVIQHEVDHLNGILFIDHLPAHRKQRAIKKVETWKRRNGFKHKSEYPTT